MAILQDLFIREYGKPQSEAPTLIFIHGLLGWGLNWSPVIKYFENDYNILTYDQRGHGRSFHPKTGYSPEDYADDLLQLMKAKGLQRAHLIGHSMGARTAQCFAVREPGRVLSLVLEDMGPNPEPETTKATEKMILSVPVPFKSKNEMDEFFEQKFVDDSGRKHNEVMTQFLKANLQRQNGVGINWRFDLQGILTTLEEGLKPRWAEFKCLQVPTLILRGVLSGHLTQETMEMMLQSLPQSRGVTIEGSGHWIHYQKPEEFANHVLEFLRNLG